MIDARFRITREGFALDVDLHIPAGGVTALLGPSGCGKTTLLRAVAGLDRHDGGVLRVGGEVWQDGKTFLPAHRRPVGYVFQEASLFAHLSVRDNIAYAARRARGGARPTGIDEAAQRLGITQLLDRSPGTLSGGERQRVAIARALAAAPQLLLLDEPLASLDRESKRDILPWIESLRRGLDVPAIYVSHSIDEVARVADHLVMIEQGRVVATGPLGETLARLDLPTAADRDAEIVIDAVVAGRDEELTLLDFDGGRLHVAGRPLTDGERVRVRLAARDVSIALERPAATSILNVLPATIDEIATPADGQLTLRLRVGNTPILARITQRSAAALALTPGKGVYAQIKSVAVLN